MCMPGDAEGEGSVPKQYFRWGSSFLVVVFFFALLSVLVCEKGFPRCLLLENLILSRFSAQLQT